MKEPPPNPAYALDGKIGLGQMNPNKDPTSPESQLVKTWMFAFMAVGFIGYQMFAPSIFGSPAVSGFNPWRTVGAMVVTAVFALIGYGIGKLIGRFRR